MVTRVALAVAVVLVASTVTLADPPGVLPGTIWQQQSFAVGSAQNPGISSLINLVHGDQEADMYQFVEIDNWHNAPAYFGTPWPLAGGGGSPFWWDRDNCDTKAFQWQSGFMEQDTEAWGKSGIISVNAFLDAAGGQEQTIGGSTDPKLQMQTLGVAADQVLLRSSGGGGGEADQEADLYQEQEGLNAAGSMYESSWITVGQFGDVDGRANSTASLVGGLNAQTSQGQIVY